MSIESLRLFDPRRTIQLQGFSGPAATNTLHDATAWIEEDKAARH